MDKNLAQRLYLTLANYMTEGAFDALAELEDGFPEVFLDGYRCGISKSIEVVEALAGDEMIEHMILLAIFGGSGD